MQFSVIITCYNTLTLIKKTLKAVLDTSGNDTEIILVNNNPPFPEVLSFLSGKIHPRVKVVNPGRNLGPFDGQQYGRRRANGRYLVHVDDDTIVPSSDWLSAMSNALSDHKQLAYVSLPWRPAPPANIYKAAVFQGSNYQLAICDVDVPVTMFEAELWKKEFSFLEMKRYYFGTRFIYHGRANKIGKTCGYIISHWAEHLGRTREADILYGAWKVLYAKKSTDKDYTTWREKDQLGEKEINILRCFGYPSGELLQIREDFRRVKTGL